MKSQDSPLPDTFSLADLLELVNSTEAEKMESGEEARRITRAMRQLASSDDSLRLVIHKYYDVMRKLREPLETLQCIVYRSVIEELHKKSLESEEFGRKAARAFGSVSQLEVAGVKLRDVVLRNIQTDFKSRCK